MMKKYILKCIKDKLDHNGYEWATNYVAMKYQSTLETPEAKKQVEMAKVNMINIEKTMAYLKKLSKDEGDK
jgi:hypothetical protein